MANDNQTALQQSIQRKKDEITLIRSKYKGQVVDTPDGVQTFYTMSESDSTRINFLESEIAEDEKLLPTEKEQLISFAEDVADEIADLDEEGLYWDSAVADKVYQSKYGSDE